MKANRSAKFPTDDRGMIEGGGFLITGTLMLSLGIVFALALLPNVEDGAAQTQQNPNASKGEKGIVGTYPLMFAALPLMGMLSVGYGGYRFATSH